MGTPLLIDGYRALLLWSAQPGGRPWSTKFDYVQNTGAAPAPVEEVAEQVAGTFSNLWTTGGTSLRNNFATGTSLQGVRVYRLTNPLTGVEIPPPSAVAGGQAAVLPAEVAVVASLRTNFLGRRFRGRQFWGGLSSAGPITTTGQVSQTFRDQLTTLVEGMGFIATDDWSIVHSIISGQGLDIARPPGLATPITSVTVDQFPDTQRRRGAR